jgi:hypothetical protein
MIEMVVPLMADDLLQRTVPRPSIPYTKASFVSTAIRLVAPVMDKHHEAGESTSSVFLSDLGAALVPDVRLWEVSGEPVSVVEGVFQYLKICNHVTHRADDLDSGSDSGSDSP